MKMTIFGLERAAEWDHAVLHCSSHSVFHSMAWARVLHESYGHVPAHIAIREGKKTFLVPMMEVRTPVFGRRGVCMPFSDRCGPIPADPHAGDVLDAALVEVARQKGWRELVIREDCGLPSFSRADRYVEHVLGLNGGLQRISRSLRPSTWRNIQRAERTGVRVEIRTTDEAADEYYRLHCITRKRLGVPPQPKGFFEAIQRHLISTGNGQYLLARYGGITIASALFLHFGTRAVYKFNASLPDRDRLRPNNLIMWEAIRWLVEHGYRELSLGRSDPDDAGLLQFKNGWGAERQVVHYIRWPVRKPAGESHLVHRRVMLRAVARKLPLPVLRLAGSLVYRYLG